MNPWEFGANCMGGGSLTSNLDLSYETSVHQSELGTWPAKKKKRDKDAARCPCYCIPQEPWQEEGISVLQYWG